MPIFSSEIYKFNLYLLKYNRANLASISRKYKKYICIEKQNNTPTI